MQGWVYVAEEVPDVANHDSHDLVPRYRPVHDETEAHEHPWQIGRREDEQTQEAEPGFGVPPRPYVDEGRRQWGPEEGHRHKRRNGDEAGRGVHEQP